MVVPSYYILTSYVLDLKHAYLDMLRAYHWILFYTLINMVFPCEMLIDYHTKKFSHLNTLMRFITSTAVLGFDPEKNKNKLNFFTSSYDHTEQYIKTPRISHLCVIV